jgi:hypothetical protein
MKEIRTEIIINAPVEAVWSVLCNFKEFENWNPFIIGIAGEMRKTASLRVTLQLEGKKPMTMKPVVQDVIVNKKFEWLGKMPLGMFNGRHYFLLEGINDNQLKFTQGEYFSGWLSGIILKKISDDTRDGFINMNRASKALNVS